jgi:hypothetical protein
MTTNASRARGTLLISSLTRDVDTVYMLNTGMFRSTDGGRSATCRTPR